MTSTAAPLLILGDSPELPSGLGRIARDIAALAHADAERGLLPVRVGQLGLDYVGVPFPWPVFRVHNSGDWGAEDLPRVWNWFSRGEKGVLLSVWDAARCFGTAHLEIADMERWGYFAVDACGVDGGFGGPAAEALLAYQRVLGYGAWGAGVLAQALERADKEDLVRQATMTPQKPAPPVDWLPHGFSKNVFFPVPGDVKSVGPRTVGCVAANQPRKDLGLLFETWKLMAQADQSLNFWLHTDKEVHQAWSIPQLAADFGLDKDRLLVTTELTDHEIAGMYRSCLVTIAPGLGEGFGYPILESLACGAPVVHGEYGGGAEWVPQREWVVGAAAYRWESCYVLKRPVYKAEDFASAALAALYESTVHAPEVRAYCAGAVENLEWRQLWPRWRSWIKRGLVGGELLEGSGPSDSIGSVIGGE